MSTEERHLIVVVEESDSTVGIYDSQAGSEVGRIEVGFWPHEIEVAPDGKTAYVTNFGVKDYDERIGRPGASISVIDLQHYCEVRRLYTFRLPYRYRTRRAPHGVKLSPQGQLFVNVEQEARMLVFDPADEGKSFPARSFSLASQFGAAGNPDLSFEPTIEYLLPKGTHNFIFNEDGTTLFLVSGLGGITAVAPESGKVKYERVFPSSPVRGLVYTPDGKHLIASLKNELRLLNPDDLTDYRLLDNQGKGFDVGQFLYSKPSVPDSEGRYEILAPAVWQSQVVFVDPETGKLAGRALTGLDPIHLQVSPDGAKAYVTHGRSRFISVIDIASRAVVGRLTTRGGPNGIAIASFYPPPARGTITVGACLPLSGPNGIEGREIRLGYEYWKERVNGAGGILADGKPHSVEIVYRDYASQGKTADLAQELITKEGAQFLFGTYPSPEHLAYAKVAEDNKRPLITATGAGTEIYGKGYRYLFGIMSPASLYLSGTVEVVRMQISDENPTVTLMSCNDFAAFEDAKATALFALRKGFRVVTLGTPPPDPFKIERVEATVDGEEVVFEILVYPDRHQEFAAVLRMMKDELDLDLCLVTGHLGESIALVKQADAVGFSPRAFALSVGPAIATFRAKLTEEGVSPEHLFGAAQWTAEVPVVGQDAFITPDEFARAFFERFSMNASYFSAGAYACGLVLQEAIRRAGTAEPTKVRDEIAALSLDTFFAHIEFDKRGLNHKKQMYTIQLRSSGAEFRELILWPPQGAVWPRPSPGK